MSAGSRASRPCCFFLGYRYVEPLHTLLTVLLFPMWLVAVRGRLPPRAWTALDAGPEHERRRALLGQLLLLAVAVGIAVGGAAISMVGLTGVFVPSDLVFLDVTALALDDANPRLLGFIARGCWASSPTTAPASGAPCWRPASRSG